MDLNFGWSRLKVSGKTRSQAVHPYQFIFTVLKFFAYHSYYAAVKVVISAKGSVAVMAIE